MATSRIITELIKNKNLLNNAVKCCERVCLNYNKNSIPKELKIKNDEIFNEIQNYRTEIMDLTS